MASLPKRWSKIQDYSTFKVKNRAVLKHVLKYEHDSGAKVFVRYHPDRSGDWEYEVKAIYPSGGTNRTYEPNRSDARSKALVKMKKWNNKGKF